MNGLEQHELVQRIVASRPFARAPQIRDFLLFIAERASSDGGASINETEIGRLVLRRRQSNFDPNTDNIVRVQARHLREKLAEYFDGEGRDEPVVVTIPKGTYVPKFEARQAVVPRESRPPAAPRRRFWIVLGLLAVAVVAGGWWVANRTIQPKSGARMQAAPRPESQPLWAAFASTGRRTSIVLSDSSVSVAQNLLRRPVNLSEYLSPAYPRDLPARSGDGRTAAVLSEITKHPYTSLNSAIVASRLQLTAHQFGVEASLRFPRDITIREFESENFVLIGSRRSVPWMELIEEQLNFVLAGNPERLDFYMINKAPRAGEQPMYRPGSGPDGTPTFASVALLPNVTGKGLIMCLQGLSGMANEAAEQLINNPKTSPVSALLRSLPSGAPPHLEILVRATGMAGAPVKTQIIATRASGHGNKGQPGN